MRKQLFILSTLVLFALGSCQKYAGDPVTKEFSIEGPYTELDVSDGFEVTVSDAVSEVTVTVGENIMPKVVVEIVENTLKIYLKGINHSNYGSDMIVVLPYNSNLMSVELSGASEFHSEFALEGQKVDVELSGASEFYCDVDADKVEIDMTGASNFNGEILADEVDLDMSGASSIKGALDALDLDLEMSGGSDVALEGQVLNLEINMSGASNIVKKVVGNRYGLVCDKCEGEMSGASDAYIHCDGTIKVRLSGGSELHYTGNAATTGSDCSGGSELSHDVL